MTRREQRIRIMNCIYQHLLTEKKIDDILEDNIDINDKESIEFIVTNTIGVIGELDALIKQIEPLLIDYRFKRLGYVEQALLLLSTYQLNLKQIDKPIIINEAIEIAKMYCDDEAPRFINGILDKI
ncbi:MAG TPA: transcription antitermination factor NusB [Bacteroidales bacterium]|jgi:N utilization substance protein B|nr:transcription antitermination factor NusB [Erysipelotrichia bacterium]HPX46147.1 transcription antitermination factor NusB [Bacteroidales bacterium]HQA85316.1 transcription antitermination factor NusB [Erysipelotrichaceae bacterium]